MKDIKLTIDGRSITLSEDTLASIRESLPQQQPKPLLGDLWKINSFFYIFVKFGGDQYGTASANHDGSLRMEGGIIARSEDIDELPEILERNFGNGTAEYVGHVETRLITS